MQDTPQDALSPESVKEKELKTSVLDTDPKHIPETEEVCPKECLPSDSAGVKPEVTPEGEQSTSECTQIPPTSQTATSENMALPDSTKAPLSDAHLEAAPPIAKHTNSKSAVEISNSSSNAAEPTVGGLGGDGSVGGSGGSGWGVWGGWGGSLWSSVSTVAESAQAIGQKVVYYWLLMF